MVALKLRSCSCTELYLVTRVLAYFLRRFWAECTVSSSSIARSRLFAHVFAHSVHLRSSSAPSFVERSFRTFLQLRLPIQYYFSDFCDSDDIISSGHVHIFPYADPGTSSKCFWCATTFIRVFRGRALAIFLYTNL